MKTRLAGVALCAAIGSIAHAGGEIGFAPYEIQQVGSWADAIAIGDLNGDRLDDVVLATTFYFDEANDYSTFIFLQRPDGTLAPPFKSRYGEQRKRNLDIELVDLDGDEVREAVVSRKEGLTIYRWDGAGFQSRMIAAEGGCNWLAALDIDSDGHADIACQKSAMDGVTLFFGDGHGGMRASSPLAGAGDQFDDMKAGDVTGDGLPDLVASAFYAFFVHANDGAGGLSPAVAYPSPGGVWSLGAIAIGDMDSDGRNDVSVVVAANSPEAALYVYHQADQGTLAETPVRHASYDIPAALVTHDLNRDGRSDLLVGHRGWSSIGHYLQGTGGLATEQLADAVFNSSSGGLAAGDLNDDGCVDAGIAEWSAGLVTLAGANCHRPPTHGDFDGDGRADLLWHHAPTGASAIWRAGNFSSQQAVTRVANPDWDIVATGDFDGDGTTDIVWHNARTGVGTIWKSGNFASQQSIVQVTNVAWRIVGAGDFDGDGRDDLVWRNATSGGNAIWKGGSFHAQLAVPAVTNLDWTIAGAGDLDGDGRDELVWRNAATGTSTAWRGANYRDNIAIAAAGAGWSLAAIGDFDGDRTDDLFWRHADGRNVAWRAGSSLRPMPVAAVPSHWMLAAVADYDGNGKDDVSWRHRLTGANAVWRAASASVNRSLTTVTAQDWKIQP